MTLNWNLRDEQYLQTEREGGSGGGGTGPSWLEKKQIQEI